jgi:rhamnose utilization protein RhaD (predicted bifunctional aldolase and dehydrogenase)
VLSNAIERICNRDNIAVFIVCIFGDEVVTLPYLSVGFDGTETISTCNGRRFECAKIARAKIR